MAIGKAGLRDGSTSAEGGPEPRAATRRRFLAPSMASMARTGLERPRSGAEGGVEPARPCPALHWAFSRRAISGGFQVGAASRPMCAGRDGAGVPPWLFEGGVPCRCELSEPLRALGAHAVPNPVAGIHAAEFEQSGGHGKQDLQPTQLRLGTDAGSGTSLRIGVSRPLR